MQRLHHQQQRWCLPAAAHLAMMPARAAQGSAYAPQDGQPQPGSAYYPPHYPQQQQAPRLPPPSSAAASTSSATPHTRVKSEYDQQQALGSVSSGVATSTSGAANAKGGASEFVKKLYKSVSLSSLCFCADGESSRMLEDSAHSHIVSWGSKGDSFLVKVRLPPLMLSFAWCEGANRT